MERSPHYVQWDLLRAIGLSVPSEDLQLTSLQDTDAHAQSIDIWTQWKLWSLDAVSTCIGHTDNVGALALMPDGQRILSGSDDHTIRVWLLDGTLQNLHSHHTAQVEAVLAMPDNQHALSGSQDNSIKLFNVNDGAVLRTFRHHTSVVWRLALLPDGLRFVSGSEDNTARIAYHGFAPMCA